MTPRELLRECEVDVARMARVQTEPPTKAYRVITRDGRRMLLRLRPPEQALTPEAARLQQRWLAALATDPDVAVPSVVPLRGELTQPCDEFQAALIRWVAGNRVTGPKAFVVPRRLAAVGESLARVHLGTQRFRLAIPRTVRRYDADYFFAPPPPAGSSLLRSADRELLKRLEKRTRAAMSDLGESPSRFGLIHGDLGPANWVFKVGDARPIDFDEFGIGHFVLDLVKVLWTHATWADHDQHMARLIVAYERVRKLDEVERRHLKLVQALPQVDWLRRKLTADDHKSLKQWMPRTLECMRACMED